MKAGDSPLATLLVGLELVLDHAYHDLVADETTLVHDLLGFLAKLGALSNLLAEHVTGSKVADQVVEALKDLGGLGTLACARRPDEDHANTSIVAAATGNSVSCRANSGRSGRLELLNLVIQLGDQCLEVRELGRGRGRVVALGVENACRAEKQTSSSQHTRQARPNVSESTHWGQGQRECQRW